MKRWYQHKSLWILLFTVLSIFVIYNVNADHKITYLALGDSLALGQNAYGAIDYGYSDYLANYFEKNNMLGSYSKSFAQSGYRTTDLLNDIEKGKEMMIDGKKVNIKRALRESNFLTLSIGANDFFELLNQKGSMLSLPTEEVATEILNEIDRRIDRTLKEIRKYAKGEIYVIGYYNPLPRTIKNEIVAPAMEKMNIMYQKISEKYHCTYVAIDDVMARNMDYLPNPNDIHPSSKGYEQIAMAIIKQLNEN